MIVEKTNRVNVLWEWEKGGEKNKDMFGKTIWSIFVSDWGDIQIKVLGKLKVKVGEMDVRNKDVEIINHLWYTIKIKMHNEIL